MQHAYETELIARAWSAPASYRADEDEALEYLDAWTVHSGWLQCHVLRVEALAVVLSVGPEALTAMGARPGETLDAFFGDDRRQLVYCPDEALFRAAQDEYSTPPAENRWAVRALERRLGQIFEEQAHLGNEAGEPYRRLQVERELLIGEMRRLSRPCRECWSEIEEVEREVVAARARLETTVPADRFALCARVEGLEARLDDLRSDASPLRGMPLAGYPAPLPERPDHTVLVCRALLRGHVPTGLHAERAVSGTPVLLRRWPSSGG